jgi:peptidoglycan hydrolase-like protein with peptidoglycan-binding domain
MHLAPVEVALLARRAGFSGNDLTIAVAISFAEDPSHDEQARYHPGAGSLEDSRGLWQINVGGALWEDRKVRYGLSTPDALYDGATNARVAHQIYRDRSSTFLDWATYLHRSYLNYWSGALAAVAQSASPGHVLTRYLKELEPMQRGADVAAWQAVCGARTDGWFGPLTSHGTKVWQGKHNLATDGIVGPLTARAAGWIWSPR